MSIASRAAPWVSFCTEPPHTLPICPTWAILVSTSAISEIPAEDSTKFIIVLSFWIVCSCRYKYSISVLTYFRVDVCGCACVHVCKHGACDLKCTVYARLCTGSTHISSLHRHSRLINALGMGGFRKSVRSAQWKHLSKRKTPLREMRQLATSITSGQTTSRK